MWNLISRGCVLVRTKSRSRKRQVERERNQKLGSRKQKVGRVGGWFQGRKHVQVHPNSNTGFFISNQIPKVSLLLSFAYSALLSSSTFPIASFIVLFLFYFILFFLSFCYPLFDFYFFYFILFVSWVHVEFGIHGA